MKKDIYLDNNASTCIDARVADKLKKFLELRQANPSSVHRRGQAIRQVLIESRDEIADFLGVKPKEIIFTSGGTEALNIAIRGFIGPDCKGHIISSDVEHPAVFNTLKALESLGCDVTYLPAGMHGAVTAEQVKEAIRPDTRLLTLMAVNNETGVKTDILEIASLTKSHSIPFVVDAVALMGKESFTIPDGVSAMCFSGHKFHAPQGTGFLFLRAKTKICCHTTGGGHENNKRSGTENMLGIVGLAEATRILREELPEASQRMQDLRDRLEKGIMESLEGVSINGTGPRTPNTSNLSFEGVEGESLLMNLDQRGILASHGSACSSGALQASRILMNMGIEKKLASSAIRFSLSRMTREEDITYCTKTVVDIVKELRMMVAT
ncbi:Cysteine desulfurase IscS [Chlamydiales bacterium SCGC AG-110-M15]|nr:Cysteine desulfurase IscS [Chlamydiales bacterium SCGC AG-110-M15]